MITNRTILINDEDVDCEIHYVVSNDGIGAYEYWGQKSYDAGFDYIEVEDIVCEDPTIMKYIDDNWDELSERIAIEMEEDGLIDEIDYDDNDDAWSGGFADNH